MRKDRQFLHRRGNADGTDRSIVLAILAMAESLHLTVVAEGIEEPTQRDTLIALGCHLGQGYLFARELSAQDATRLLGVMSG